ncbi:unnamed protein product [Blumeria hordei]|uniref:Uncharacterized protein n=1 Tax=Blumeria hordei TaxID=2867405 RepID=A0A383UQ85_BLUHO|nr:unnamed protein product [Blumeria hordei]
MTHNENLFSLYYLSLPFNKTRAISVCMTAGNSQRALAMEFP